MSTNAERVQKILSGEVRACARLMRDLDDEVPAAREVLAELHAHTGHAFIVGITGNPGSGKSTLTDQLVAHWRASGKTVGVVAVDPTSPFTGGAILGDRVRMQRHATDEGVFIRSVATRGNLGGISRSTLDIVRVLDAMGKDIVVIETVGVGQDEIEVTRAAHTSVVVVVPGLGDDIQAIKAGILEIADLFVINKADREGADRLHADLDYMLSLGSYKERPRPGVLRTIAIRDEGVEQLREELDRFLEREHGQRIERRRERSLARLLAVLTERLMARAMERVLTEERLEQLVEAIADRRLDPYSAVDEIVEELEAL